MISSKTRTASARCPADQAGEPDGQPAQDDGVGVVGREPQPLALRAVARASSSSPRGEQHVRPVGEHPGGLAAAELVLLDQPLRAGRPGAGPHRLRGVLQDERAGTSRRAPRARTSPAVEEPLVGPRERVADRSSAPISCAAWPSSSRPSPSSGVRASASVSTSTHRRHWKAAKSSRASARTRPSRASTDRNSPSGRAMDDDRPLDPTAVTAALCGRRLDSGGHGVWRSLVAHPLWERGAVGSNPATPTLPTTSLDS